MFVAFLFIVSYLCGGTAANPYRLPTTVVPKVYNLTITTEFQNDFPYHGTVEIYLNVSLSSILENNKFNISLNKGPQLFINENLTLLAVEGFSNDLTPTNTFYCNDTEIYTMEFSLNSKINATGIINTTAILTIPFKSFLRKDMRGYYLSSYTTSSGYAMNAAVTQFESTDARQAFPCWDEPSFKAMFQVTLIGPSMLTMLSNMDELSRVTTGGACLYNRSDGSQTTNCDITVFNPSEPMSTYLVAFIIGEYESVELQKSDLKGSVLTRVFFPASYPSSAAEFALENAFAILPYYEELFQVPYPLPKMDHVAIFDFAAGAMENWGLITYRTTDLLVGTDASLASLKNVVVVVAHELAHQWFGDLVTMEWWNDLWLNEGFASFMENLGVSFVQPEYEIWDDFVLAVSGALDQDVSSYTHPIQQPVSDPNEINQLFDTITYDKGSALLRMLYEFMGETQFMKGINAYLTKYKYGNAQSYQLWEELSNFGDYNITEMMDTWILNPGFPVLTVNTTARRIILTQNRMTKDGPRNDDNGTLWQIPISVQNGGTNTPPRLMTQKEYTINATNQKYFLINADFQNYYRVWYDSTSFQRIESEFMSLSAINQFTVLSDRFALTMNNYVNTREYLFFLKRVCDNSTNTAVHGHISQVSYLVWSEIIANVLTVDDLFCEYGYGNGYLTNDSATGHDGNILTGFRKFATGYLKQLYNVVGGYDSSVQSTNNNITQLRPEVILALIQMGDKTAIQDGERIYQEDVVNHSYSLNTLDPNLVTCVLSAALATNNQDYFNQITKMIYPSVDSTHQDYILSSLGALYTDDDLMNKAINFVLNGTVRDNAKIRGLYSCRRCKGRFNVWTSLTQDDGTAWDDLAAIFGSGFAMSDLTAVFNTFASDTMLDNVKSFYDSNDRTTSANARVVNQTVEAVYSRQMWLESNRGQVQDFLEAIGDYSNNNGGNGGGGDSDSGDKNWYEEWWFILIIVVVCLLLASAVAFYVFRRRRKRQDDYLKISEKENAEF